MDSTLCTHAAAREQLEKDNPESALRVAGPMIERDPSDVNAWRLAALAAARLGDDKTAIKNLRSVSLALARSSNPILALAQAIELGEMGVDNEGLLEEIAELYSAESKRIEEMDLTPPPLPSGAPAEPWPENLGLEQLLARGSEAMAMAWGSMLTEDEGDGPLPYLPLFSALDSENFVRLGARLERRVAMPQEEIVRQGESGEAMYVIADGTVEVTKSSPDGEETTLARLGPGAFFGEMSLVSCAARAAGVRATSRTVLLRAGREELEELVERSPAVGDVLVAFCHARMLENLVRISPVLAPVPPRRRPELIARFDTDYREAGETIISEGEEGPGLFLIVSGEVRVSREEDGDDVQVAALGPGDLFGEISLVMRKPSTATVIAAENTALLFLSRKDFNEATRDFPELLKGAYDIAVTRETRNSSILGQQAISADDLVML
ncbi:MAG: cyclic nucleotide-binding domain-containing protein [Polyangia bacterium]